MSRTKKTLQTRIIEITILEVRVPFDINNPNFNFERHGCLATNLEFDFNSQKSNYASQKTRDEWESLAYFVNSAEKLGAKVDSAVFNNKSNTMDFRLCFNSYSEAVDFRLSLENLKKDYIVQNCSF